MIFLALWRRGLLRRIDGEKLCTTSNFNPAEECTVYPAGKKSGDSFEMTGAQGTATITIK